MGGHSHHRTYDTQAIAVIAIFTGLLFYIFWGGNPTVLSIAENTFDLTPEDLKMIPISGIGFLVFCWLMQKFFFARVIALIETREAMTEGAQSSAQDLLQKAEDLQKEAEQKLFDARLAGAQAKMATLNKARSEAQSISDGAQARTAEQLKIGRGEIEARSAELESQLLSQLSQLTDTAVKKVLALPEQRGGGLQ